MMEANITAGQCLNDILSSLYPQKTFIPFNEAMITGEAEKPYFSDEFCEKRAKFHNVSLKEYCEKLQLFRDFLKNIHSYDNVVMWFGDDDFCLANVEFLKKLFLELKYKNEIILNTVDELSGVIKSTNII